MPIIPTPNNNIIFKQASRANPTSFNNNNNNNDNDSNNGTAHQSIAKKKTTLEFNVLEIIC